jgi:hypothetical protein
MLCLTTHTQMMKSPRAGMPTYMHNRACKFCLHQACTNSPTKKEFHTLVPCTGHACMHWLIQPHASTLPLQHENALSKVPVLLALQHNARMTMLTQWTSPCRRSARLLLPVHSLSCMLACEHNTQPASCIGTAHGCTCTPQTLTSQIAYVIRWRKCAPCAGMAVVEYATPAVAAATPRARACSTTPSTSVCYSRVGSCADCSASAWRTYPRSVGHGRRQHSALHVLVASC